MDTNTRVNHILMVYKSFEKYPFSTVYIPKIRLYLDIRQNKQNVAIDEKPFLFVVKRAFIKFVYSFVFICQHGIMVMKPLQTSAICFSF